jgi:uncharacterized protein with HEPN domain
MNRIAEGRLLDALAAGRAIREFVGGRTLADYERNLMLRSAVERQFEILGEALNQASLADEAVSEAVPDLRKIVGLRNRLIHGYDVVDNQIVWRLVHDELPPLLGQLEAAISQ